MIHRPKRLLVVCRIAAVCVFVMFSTIGIALTNANFQPGDKYAMIGLGAVFGLAILTIARPRVEADEWGVKVRNIIGGYQLPWGVVRRIAFDRGQPWLYLELENDDTVSVLAVQAVDREHAVEAVTALRALHAKAHTTM